MGVCGVNIISMILGIFRRRIRPEAMKNHIISTNSIIYTHLETPRTRGICGVINIMFMILGIFHRRTELETLLK